MRHVGTIGDEREAQRFAAHLLTLGIHSRPETEDGRVAIWIVEEDHVQRAREELREFLENPSAPRYHEAEEAARRIRKERESREKRARKNFVDVGARWRYSGPGRRALTFTLIGASVIATMVTRFGDLESPTTSWLTITWFEVLGQSVRYHRGLYDVLHGEVWRLVTPIFLHFNFIHILFNMLWLHELGSQIEMRRGTLRFAIFVLALAAISNVLQYWIGDSFRFGGMSGVVYGLFGYVWMRAKYDPVSGFVLHRNTVILMVGWFLLCFTGLVGPIANIAHTAGLAVGVIVGYAPVLLRKLPRTRR
jgi:GlpG protein